MSVQYFLLPLFARQSSQDIVKKIANPGLFFIYFQSFQSNIITILQQINVKNVHPQYGTGIRTLNRLIMSLHP